MVLGVKNLPNNAGEGRDVSSNSGLGSSLRKGGTPSEETEGRL